MEGGEEEGPLHFANITSPADVTSRGVRERSSYFPERLWNAESTQEALYKYLIERRCVDPLLLSVVRTVVLFGRKGSGKSTILHTRDPQDSTRFLFLDVFDRVLDWKMRAWNHGGFVAWAQNAIHHVAVVDSVNRAPGGAGNGPHEDTSLLIVIQDIHLLTNLRDPVYMNTFLQLMTAIRMANASHSAIRLVMTCSDVPSVLPVEFRQLVDQLVFVPLPTPQHSHGIILDWMRRFRSLSSQEPSLRNLTWSIELDDDTVENDPDHILNALTLAARGATPRELYAFMKRLNDACSNPREDGSTDMNEEFIEKMLYKTEGGGKSVVPYDIEKENSAVNKYLGLDFETAAGVAQGNPLTIVPDPLNQRLLSPNAHPQAAAADGDGAASRKRKGEGGEEERSRLPPHVAEALRGETEKRAKVMKGVELRAQKRREAEEAASAARTASAAAVRASVDSLLSGGGGGGGVMETPEQKKRRKRAEMMEEVLQ